MRIYVPFISIPLLGAAILFSIVNAKRNRKMFLANVETRKGLQLVLVFLLLNQHINCMLIQQLLNRILLRQFHD